VLDIIKHYFISMTKFLALYMAPTESFVKALQASQDEMQAGMEVWNAWMSANKDAIVDIGAPLGRTKRISLEGVSDIKNQVGGYSIVQAESHDAAAKLFLEHPHYQIEGGWVELMEYMPMPGS
jgi:hypothetical protein